MAGRKGGERKFLNYSRGRAEGGGGTTIEGTYLGLSLEEAHFGHGLVWLPVYTLEEWK